MNPKEIQKRYGESEQNNFRAVDTIGVPHPYCISPKHLQFNEGMYLNPELAEKRSKELYPNNPRKQAVCYICKGKLSFAEHKQALLVECDIPNAENEIINKELHTFLLAIKQKLIEDKFEGVAFKKSINFKEKN